jgi:hypothetical protein
LKKRTSINSLNKIFHKEKEMVDFRKWFPALAVVAVVLGSAASASAQVQTVQMACQSNASATPLVRAEGISELVGDVVLICQGGTPTVPGAVVPQVNIQVFLNTNITSRLVADPYSEALILIDDPAPAQQVACIPASYATPAGLPPSTTTCPVAGVGGSGVNFKSGGVPNIYQARSAGVSALQWLGVPIDPPGTTGTRTIRITNVRANASQLGTSSTLIPTQIQMFISVTPPQSLPLNNPQQTVAFVSPGMSFSLRNAANDATSSGITFLQCVSNNPDIAGDNSKPLNTAGISAVARFGEGFASAFKRRNVSPYGSTGGSTPIPADTSPTPANQDTPGGLAPLSIGGQYFTETGFYAGAGGGSLNGKANGLANAGLADTGTRLMLRFAGIPAGAQIFVGIYELGRTGAGAPPVLPSRVRLVATDASGAGAFTAVTATSGGTYAPVAISGGVGVAVYEVMSGDPLSQENIDVPIVLAFSSNTTTNTPGLGTGTVTGSFAPLSTVTTQSASAPVPRFIDVPSSKTAFTINACSTNLLFPFVTNQAGFDTGIAIANTSLDPFKTATQAGPCTINYYGNTTGGGAAPAPFTTTTAVAAGTELVFNISSGGGGVPATPGFQGYIIAQCAFQYAHGFAFISDIGGQKVAEGYLALVMDAQATTIPRSKTASEPLGQ